MRLSLALLLVLVALSARAQFIVPTSYLSPYDPAWASVFSAGPARVPIVLLNPNSGPGPSLGDPTVQAFVSIASRAHAAGMSVYGYVDSSYTNVSLATVSSHIAAYVSWFAVDGIFVDQVRGDCARCVASRCTHRRG
jgi:hypothetical protein